MCPPCVFKFAPMGLAPPSVQNYLSERRLVSESTLVILSMLFNNPTRLSINRRQKKPIGRFCKLLHHIRRKAQIFAPLCRMCTCLSLLILEVFLPRHSTTVFTLAAHNPSIYHLLNPDLLYTAQVILPVHPTTLLHLCQTGTPITNFTTREHHA